MLSAVDAYFTGDDGSSSYDQYPGVGGSTSQTGWKTAWATATNGSMDLAADSTNDWVINTSPLNSGGNYLHVNATATDSESAGQGTVARQYQSYGNINTNAVHQIQFDYRLDSITNLTSGNDRIIFFGDGASPRTAPTGFTTWEIKATGVASGAVHWKVVGKRNGSTTTVDTGINVTTGTTYHFTVVVDPVNNNSSFWINGTTSSDLTNLGFISTTGASTWPYVNFNLSLSDADETASFSLDNFRISNPPPSAPSSLSATAASSTQINLAWTDNASTETGFIVERSTDGSTNWTQIATPAVNATSYNDTGLNPASQYFYRVRATNEGGDSANSNTANAITTPVVINDTFLAMAHRVNLHWEDGAGPASYQVQRQNGASWETIATVTDTGSPAAGYNYVDSGLISATAYNYRLIAANGATQSPAATLSATTALPSMFHDFGQSQGGQLGEPNITDVYTRDENGFMYDDWLNGVRTPNEPFDPDKTAATAHDVMQNRGGWLVLDIESWTIDSSTMAQRFEDLIDTIRTAEPNIKLGCYAPLFGPKEYDFYMAHPGGPLEARIATWQEGVDTFVDLMANYHPVIGGVRMRGLDFVSPSLYGTSGNIGEFWEYASGTIEQANRLGLPTYSFLWPKTISSGDSWPAGGIDPRYYRAQLVTLSEVGDGAVAWDAPPKVGNVDPSWLAVTKQYISDFQAQSAAPAAPSDFVTDVAHGTMSWNDNSFYDSGDPGSTADEEFFIIERSEDGVHYGVAGVIAGRPGASGEVDYDDLHMLSNKDYIYRVAALSARGTLSAYANPPTDANPSGRSAFEPIHAAFYDATYYNPAIGGGQRDRYTASLGIGSGGPLWLEYDNVDFNDTNGPASAVNLRYALVSNQPVTVQLILDATPNGNDLTGGASLLTFSGNISNSDLQLAEQRFALTNSPDPDGNGSNRHNLFIKVSAPSASILLARFDWVRFDNQDVLTPSITEVNSTTNSVTLRLSGLTAEDAQHHVLDLSGLEAPAGGDITEYKVYYGTSPNFINDENLAVTGEPSGTDFEVGGLDPQTQYYFRVLARDDAPHVVTGYDYAWYYGNQEVQSTTLPVLEASNAGEHTVHLQWEPFGPTGATYVISRSDLAPYVQIGGPTTATSFTDTTVATGEYTYKVTAGTGASARTIFADELVTPVYGLQTSVNSSAGTVTISWDDPAGESSQSDINYLVYRSEFSTLQNGHYTQIAGGTGASALTDTHYTDTPPTPPGGSWYYIVVARWGFNFVNTPPAATGPVTLAATPQNIHFTAVPGDNSDAIAWDAVTGASGYTVHRTGTDSSSTNFSVGTNSFSDTSIPLGVTYTYTVTATVSGWISNNSNAAVASFGDSGDDSLYARYNSGTGNVDFFNNSTGTGTPTLSVLYSNLGGIAFSGNGGTDLLTTNLWNSTYVQMPVYYRGGSPTTVPGDNVKVISGTSDNGVTLTSSIMTLSFEKVTTNTVEGWMYDGNGGNDVLTVSGTPRFVGDIGAGAGTVNVTVTGGGLGSGYALFDATQHLNTLTLNSGSARLTSGGGKVLVVNSIGFISDGNLDLTDNDMVVRGGTVGTWDGSEYTGLTGLIASGRDGGAWDGSGIVTSSASGNYTTLGIATAQQSFSLSNSNDTTAFDGQTVTGTDVLIKYTYGGDATLDGKIAIDDYGRYDYANGLGIAGWFNADVNYDGVVNIDDYGIMDFNAGIQGDPL